MTLADLIAAFNGDTDNLKPPGRWRVEDLARWAAEAEEEAAIRKRLLFDDVTTTIVQRDVLAGTSVYKRDSRMFDPVKAYLYRVGVTRDPIELDIELRDDIQRERASWRTIRGVPSRIVFDQTTFTLPGVVDRDYTLRIEGYRTPKNPLAVNELGREPEIAKIHHRFLVEWMKFRAYSVPDTEILNPGASQVAELAFIARFGHRWQANRETDNAATRRFVRAYF